MQRSLFQAVGRVLHPEGTFNQLTEIPWLYQRLYQRHFEDVQFVLEPRNLPAGRHLFLPPPAAARMNDESSPMNAQTGTTDAPAKLPLLARPLGRAPALECRISHLERAPTPRDRAG